MSETMNIPPSVTKKLLAVMAEVSYIQKDKKNDFHKYSYASEKAIKETLHPILVKHGLLFLPVGCEPVSERENVTSKGNKESVLTIRYFYRWVDAETGDATDVLHAMGTGADSSDKSVYKGLTGAIKYILTGTFLIPTGDDPEVHHDEKRPAKAPTPIQQAAPAAMVSAIKAMRHEIGDGPYNACLDRHGVKKSSDLKGMDQAKTLLDELGKIRMSVVASTHGEGAGLTEALFNSLPETNRGKVMVEMVKKIADATGSAETAKEEYERHRAASGSQWELYMKLDKCHEFYVTGKASA